MAVLAGALLLTAFSLFNYFGSSGNKETGTPSQEVAQEIEALHMPTHLIDVYSKNEKYYDTLDGGYLYVHDNIVDTRRHCEFCTSIDYQPGLSTGELDLTWAAEKEFNISAAKKVTFYVMGEDGGEKIKFKAAGKKLDKLLDGKPDDVAFDIVTQPVTLDDEWKKFEIDLTKANLAGVSNPFGIAVDKEDNQGPVRVFVKAIVLEDEPAAAPLPQDPEEEKEEDEKEKRGGDDRKKDGGNDDKGNKGKKDGNNNGGEDD